ncbi:hypothetical protein V3851_26395 [Paenibacillus sp. M1]|uniref:Lipoprotein n=1 Tax=Paenibacillus haidiansis TaxID=1574488 RepID=A0ABU7VZW2_9BACL
MNKGWRPTLIVTAVFVMLVTGCAGQPNAPEPFQPEASVDKGVEGNEKNAPEPVEEISEAATLSITVGDDVKLKTSLEHIETTFDGTEYTIEPYGVTFALRTTMGEPVVESERIVFSSDLSGEATITYEVMENTSLDEAVAKELEDYEGTFSGKFVETVSKGGLKGKHNQYHDSTAFSGVFFYEFDRHVLRIEYRSPIAAVDAMVRIVNETMDSVRTVA